MRRSAAQDGRSRNVRRREAVAREAQRSAASRGRQTASPVTVADQCRQARKNDGAARFRRHGHSRPSDGDLQVSAITGQFTDADRGPVAIGQIACWRRALGRIVVVAAAGARAGAQIDAHRPVAVHAKEQGGRIPRNELRRQQKRYQKRTRHHGTPTGVIPFFSSSRACWMCQYELPPPNASDSSRSSVRSRKSGIIRRVEVSARLRGLRGAKSGELL
jgi:hypothetical protein